MKRFLKFEKFSYKENDLIKFEYVCIYKSFIKPIYKRSRIQSIEDARKEKKFFYKRLEENKYF